MAEEPEEVESGDDWGCDPLPGFFQIPLDHPDRDLAIHAYVAQLLSYPEGGMSPAWKEEFSALVVAIKTGQVSGKAKLSVAQ